MRWNRLLFTLVLALPLLAGISCSSDTTSIVAPAAPGGADELIVGDGFVGDAVNGVVGTVGGVTDLLTCRQQKYDVERKVVGPEGGVIRVGTHTLVIPRGALRSKTRITAEQMPGSTNSVRFSPEGLRFDKPAALTLSYKNCLVTLLTKKIVYTDEGLSILELLKSKDYERYDYVTSPIDHFSRYAVAF